MSIKKFVAEQNQQKEDRIKEQMAQIEYNRKLEINLDKELNKLVEIADTIEQYNQQYNQQKPTVLTVNFIIKGTNNV